MLVSGNRIMTRRKSEPGLGSFSTEQLDIFLSQSCFALLTGQRFTVSRFLINRKAGRLVKTISTVHNYDS